MVVLADYQVCQKTPYLGSIIALNTAAKAAQQNPTLDDSKFKNTMSKVLHHAMVKAVGPPDYTHMPSGFPHTAHML